MKWGLVLDRTPARRGERKWCSAVPCSSQVVVGCRWAGNIKAVSEAGITAAVSVLVLSVLHLSVQTLMANNRSSPWKQAVSEKQQCCIWPLNSSNTIWVQQTSAVFFCSGSRELDLTLVEDNAESLLTGLVCFQLHQHPRTGNVLHSRDASAHWGRGANALMIFCAVGFLALII